MTSRDLPVPVPETGSGTANKPASETRPPVDVGGVEG